MASVLLLLTTDADGVAGTREAIRRQFLNLMVANVMIETRLNFGRII